MFNIGIPVSALLDLGETRPRDIIEALFATQHDMKLDEDFLTILGIDTGRLDRKSALERLRGIPAMIMAKSSEQDAPMTAVSQDDHNHAESVDAKLSPLINASAGARTLYHIPKALEDMALFALPAPDYIFPGFQSNSSFLHPNMIVYVQASLEGKPDEKISAVSIVDNIREALQDGLRERLMLDDYLSSASMRFGNNSQADISMPIGNSPSVGATLARSDGHFEVRSMHPDYVLDFGDGPKESGIAEHGRPFTISDRDDPGRRFEFVLTHEGLRQSGRSVDLRGYYRRHFSAVVMEMIHDVVYSENNRIYQNNISSVAGVIRKDDVISRFGDQLDIIYGDKTKHKKDMEDMAAYVLEHMSEEPNGNLDSLLSALKDENAGRSPEELLNAEQDAKAELAREISRFRSEDLRKAVVSASVDIILVSPDGFVNGAHAGQGRVATFDYDRKMTHHTRDEQAYSPGLGRHEDPVVDDIAFPVDYSRGILAGTPGLWQGRNSSDTSLVENLVIALETKKKSPAVVDRLIDIARQVDDHHSPVSACYINLERVPLSQGWDFRILEMPDVQLVKTLGDRLDYLSSTQPKAKRVIDDLWQRLEKKQRLTNFSLITHTLMSGTYTFAEFKNRLNDICNEEHRRLNRLEERYAFEVENPTTHYEGEAERRRLEKLQLQLENVKDTYAEFLELAGDVSIVLARMQPIIDSAGLTPAEYQKLCRTVSGMVVNSAVNNTVYSRDVARLEQLISRLVGRVEMADNEIDAVKAERDQFRSKADNLESYRKDLDRELGREKGEKESLAKRLQDEEKLRERIISSYDQVSASLVGVLSGIGATADDVSLDGGYEQRKDAMLELIGRISVRIGSYQEEIAELLDRKGTLESELKEQRDLAEAALSRINDVSRTAYGKVGRSSEHVEATELLAACSSASASVEMMNGVYSDKLGLLESRLKDQGDSHRRSDRAKESRIESLEADLAQQRMTEEEMTQKISGLEEEVANAKAAAEAARQTRSGSIDPEYIARTEKDISDLRRNLERTASDLGKLKSVYDLIITSVYGAEDPRRYTSACDFFINTGFYDMAENSLIKGLKNVPDRSREALVFKFHELYRKVSSELSEDAVGFFRASIGRDDDNYRNNPWAWHHLGVALRRQAEYEEAIHCLTRSVELAPDNYWALGVLGDIYKDMGDVGNARLYYEKSLNIKPNQPDVSRQLSRLK
ncbi:tetratricopeptide repeat protein [Candidatus Woesearchaeota archaeon]|nr:tetratricopeptide repeat protein [Candidatus Woesearchaeota archaeon]